MTSDEGEAPGPALHPSRAPAEHSSLPRQELAPRGGTGQGEGQRTATSLLHVTAGLPGSPRTPRILWGQAGIRGAHLHPQPPPSAAEQQLEAVMPRLLPQRQELSFSSRPPGARYPSSSQPTWARVQLWAEKPPFVGGYQPLGSSPLGLGGSRSSPLPLAAARGPLGEGTGRHLSPRQGSG